MYSEKTVTFHETSSKKTNIMLAAASFTVSIEIATNAMDCVCNWSFQMTDVPMIQQCAYVRLSVLESVHCTAHVDAHKLPLECCRVCSWSWVYRTTVTSMGKVHARICHLAYTGT